MLGTRSRSEIDFLEKKSPKIAQTQGPPPPFSYLRDISISFLLKISVGKQIEIYEIAGQR